MKSQTISPAGKFRQFETRELRNLPRGQITKGNFSFFPIEGEEREKTGKTDLIFFYSLQFLAPRDSL